MDPLCQYDPAWKSIRMGRSTETIGHVGCLLTSLAMIAGVSPAEMNALWTEKGIYQGNTAYCGNFDVASCTPWVQPARVFTSGGRSSYISLRHRYDPFPEDEWAEACSHLSQGGRAVAEVVLQGGQHFVVLDCQNRILDPWGGEVRPLCPTYGPNWEIAIVRVIAYRLEG